MQFILESILPLSIPPSLFLCAVTRSIMGLSYSRRDVDALSSIWNDSPLTLACSPPCLAGLEAVQSENHDYNGLWRVIHASYAKLFSSSPFFFLPTNASLSCLTDCACPGGVFVLTPHLRDSQLPQCIITIPSGQWKRHAVMWKGNYLWWNFLKHIRNRGRREKRKVRVRKWWWGVWKMQLSPPRTSQQVNRRFAMIWYSSAGGRWRHTEWYSDGFSTAVSLSLAHFGSCKWTFIHPPIYLLFISFFWCCKQHPFLC